MSIEHMYDQLIESEEISALDLITQHAPSDSLCAAVDPDGNLVSITGPIDLYTSPEATFFKLLESLSQNKKLTVEEVLYSLHIDIVYKKLH